MKLFLPIALGLLLSLHCFSQSQYTIYGVPLNKSEIIKRNKIVKEVIYNYKLRRNIIKDSTLFATYYYDTLGNILEGKEEKTENYSKSIKKYTRFYNLRGELTKEIEDMPSLKMVSIYEYEYDSVGNEINKYDYNEDTTRLIIHHKNYNANNQVTELLIKINNADLYVSRQYFYNADNELSKEIAFNPNGQIIYTYFYDYDKSLNKKTVYLENQDGIKKIEECFYNNDKQILKTNSFLRLPRIISRESTEYESINKVTENVYNQDNTLLETLIYEDGKKSQLFGHHYFK